MKSRNAILLVNIGTPESPSHKDVKRFISLYLNDPHVITLPALPRRLLVRLIASSRARRSALAYEKLWTADGSPLRYNLKAVGEGLQQEIGNEADVWTAMRFSSPSIHSVLQEMREIEYSQITVIPLFPFYTESTSGTIEAGVRSIISKWPEQPVLRVVRHFSELPDFIHLWSMLIQSCNPKDYDCLLFSFHGLPLSHLPASCRSSCTCQPDNIKDSMFEKPHHCYIFNCVRLADRVAKAVGVSDYRFSFQSRMGRGWIWPSTDDILAKLAAKGQKVLVAAPSFVSDCLETTIELNEHLRHLFFDEGGAAYRLVPLPNADYDWIKTLAKVYRACGKG